MSCKVFVGDIGTEISIDTGEDISTATAIIINVKKPDTTMAQWIPIPAHWPGFDADHPNNLIKYLVQDGDLNLDGKYEFQTYIELPAWSGSGESDSLVVYPKLG